MLFDNHRTTFRLLGREPILLSSAARRLAVLERTIQVDLPAAVREWYSLEGASELLTLEGDLYFQPWTIEENTKNLRQRLREQRPLWWVIGDYSSGVCFTAELAAGIDPVVHCLETDGSVIDSGDEWSERSFSAFAFTCCWHQRQEGTVSLFGTEPSFSPPHLDVLMESFDEGPHVLREDAPRERRNPFTDQRMVATRFQFFFFSPEGLVQLRSREDPRVSTTEVRWELFGTDKSALQALASRLKQCGVIS
ncbi:hypothetical protein R5W24_004980 [Gemmata sp. JC717]|uniref:hypothetical protein n=1 Tax=Gemmata algarum TaxID=2975278 RepID=UPI0021BA8365|nr:hypothetical protein [Gemmata algarum]MDY3555834.1 hypothetical protein [Gemmata algarum]